jgi:hypothetical protein
LTVDEKRVHTCAAQWSWDPGSGKNIFRIPDPGVKKALDPGSGSATLFVEIPTLQVDISRDPSGNTAGRLQEPKWGGQEILLSFENTHYCSHWLIKPLDQRIFLALKNMK